MNEKIFLFLFLKCILVTFYGYKSVALLIIDKTEKQGFEPSFN